jgi:hypothetical protein
VDRGRLLVLSIFGPEITRATPALALRRNDFVGALAGAVLVSHAVPGGKAETTANRAIARGQKVLTFDDDENTRLMVLGVRPVSVANLVQHAREGRRPPLDSLERSGNSVRLS